MIHFPHGETNVTLACQNRCVSCNHFIPVQDPWFIEPTDFERDLATASNVMHFDIYNLVGGEPTLHPSILRLIDILRKSEISDRVEITSNGQLYQKWDDAFYRAIDDLIITPYKLARADCDFIAEKCAKYGTRLEFHPVIFTWAAYKQQADSATADDRYRRCWYNINRHVIDGGYFYRCCTAPFIPNILLGMEKEADGLTLDGITDEKLTAYMNSDKTPSSCYVCASNCGARIEWKETSREKWLEESIG